MNYQEMFTIKTEDLCKLTYIEQIKLLVNTNKINNLLNQNMSKNEIETINNLYLSFKYALNNKNEILIENLYKCFEPYFPMLEEYKNCLLQQDLNEIKEASYTASNNNEKDKENIINKLPTDLVNIDDIKNLLPTDLVNIDDIKNLKDEYNAFEEKVNSLIETEEKTKAKELMQHIKDVDIETLNFQEAKKLLMEYKDIVTNKLPFQDIKSLLKDFFQNEETKRIKFPKTETMMNYYKDYCKNYIDLIKEDKIKFEDGAKILDDVLLELKKIRDNLNLDSINEKESQRKRNEDEVIQNIQKDIEKHKQAFKERKGTFYRNTNELQ